MVSKKLKPVENIMQHPRHEIIQVVWQAHDPLTIERETRALRQAENELGFPGTLIDYATYLHQCALL